VWREQLQYFLVLWYQYHERKEVVAQMYAQTQQQHQGKVAVFSAVLQSERLSVADQALVAILNSIF
jgi:hypothetical protein